MKLGRCFFYRVLNDQTVRMQGNPFGPRNPASIFSIPQDRMANLGKLHPNLVLAACLWKDLKPGMAMTAV